MRILVTGDAGFVGRHFTRRLMGQGHELFGCDIKHGRDCRDLFRNRGVYAGHGDDRFDLVIHLAAIVGGRETIDGDPIAVATDLSIDAEMFNWAVRTKQPRVVYFSSCAAYPTQLQDAAVLRHKCHEADINLDDIRIPDKTYGWAKLTGEMLARYAREQGVNVHVIRPWSGYGEDQDLTYPFPSFIQRIVRGDDPFEIWGDGEQVRDFVHIDDVVEATLEVVRLDIQKPVNVGWGRPTSFNELAELCFQIAGVRPQVRHRLDKPVGPSYRCSNNSFLRSFYSPQITLEGGIRRALAAARSRAA